MSAAKARHVAADRRLEAYAAPAVEAGAMRPGRREILWVAALFGAALAATFVTYARVPARDLYNVGEEGLAGGLSRLLIELNLPVSLIAVPLVLIALDVLRTRWAAALATLAVPMCLVTALPGVVEKSDFDAKAVNAIPAFGVALTVVLAALALRRLAGAAPKLLGDPLRVALAAAFAVGAVPYLFAELGFYAPDPILADEPTPGEDIAAVHLGSHEGMDGALLALGALALSRLLPTMASRLLAAVTSPLLAFLLSYGVANLIQDNWLEQVVKRGWTDASIPSFVEPQLSVGWGIVIVTAIAVEILWFRRERLGKQTRASGALTSIFPPATFIPR